MLSHFTLCSLTISLLSHCILCFLIGYLVMSSYCLVPSYNLCYVLISCVMSLHPLLSHDILCYIITLFDLTFGILLSRLLLSPYVLDYRLLSHYIRCYLIISFANSLYPLASACIPWYLVMSYHVSCICVAYVHNEYIYMHIRAVLFVLHLMHFGGYFILSCVIVLYPLLYH